MAKKTFKFEPHVGYVKMNRFGSRFEIPAMLVLGVVGYLGWYRPKWNNSMKIDRVGCNDGLIESVYIK